MSSQDTPDWLDDALRARPVDDDGFGARVLRVAHARRRSRRLWRLLLTMIVLLTMGSCIGVGVVGLQLFDRGFRTADLVDGRADGAGWLAAHRDIYRAGVARFDERPGLRRRDGRDAAVVLTPALAAWSTCRPDTACDSSALVGLAAYDVWRPTDDREARNGWANDEIVRRHLDRAIAMPLVDGEPAPFVAAATDVEGLARLWLGHSADGFKIFKAVAEATDRARAIGRDGGFVPTLSLAEVRSAQAAWFLGGLFVGPAAGDDDIAHVRQQHSMLACGAAIGVGGYAMFEPWLGDGVDRVGDIAGCAARIPMTAENLCDGEPPMCRASLLVLQLPLWRDRVLAITTTIPEYGERLIAGLAPREQP